MLLSFSAIHKGSVIRNPEDTKLTNLDLSHALQPAWNPVQQLIAQRVGGLVHPLMQQAGKAGAIKSHESTGWLVANPRYHADYSAVWDNPRKLILMAHGYGESMIGYCGNAAGKMRPSAREGMDSLCIKRFHGELFRDVIEKQSDHSADKLDVGDFPHGGAVIVELCGIKILVALSSLTETQDCTFALMIAGVVVEALDELDLLVEYRKYAA